MKVLLNKEGDVCNNKISILNKYKVLDGSVCLNCIRISNSFQTNTIEELKKYWSINESRLSVFTPTTTLKNLGSTPIYIDSTNELLIIGKQTKKLTDIVFSFSEIKDYSLEKKGEKIVTTKKGSINRALVGNLVAGPVGAIVGASTAKEETKTVGGIPILIINLTIPSGPFQVSVPYPSTNLISFLDKCIENNK